MFEELFDIVFIRWVNTFLILGGIVWVYVLSKKSKNFLLGVPLLTWLFQAFFFYIFYLIYYYNIIFIPITTAEILFQNWATFSRLLILITLMLYLYYINSSCWRGNNHSCT